MYDIALIIRVFINNEIQKQLKTKIKLIQYIILYMFIDQKDIINLYSINKLFVNNYFIYF